MLKSRCSLLLHLTSSHLSTFGVHSVLLVVSLQVVGEVIEVLLLHGHVHMLGFQHYHVFQVLAIWYRRIGAALLLRVGLVRVKAILQDLQAEEVLGVETVEEHFGKVHGRLEGLGIWEAASIQKYLDILLLDEVSRD